MLYSCARMATVGVERLMEISVVKHKCRIDHSTHTHGTALVELIKPYYYHHCY